MKNRHLTANELHKIEIKKDTIDGCINRMCVTDEPYELMNMFLSTNKTLKTIHDMCVKRFTDVVKKESEEQNDNSI